MLGDYDSRLTRSERDRVARYREQVELFREIANMATRPSVRARLLELAEQYEQLVDESGRSEDAKTLSAVARRG
jgi:uncharacterized protein YerC